MRPLLIGSDEKARIGAALAMARAMPVPRELIQRLAMPDKDVLALADRPTDMERPPSQHVELPVGYRTAISFEDQPAGLVRHLSVSVNQPGSLPHPAAVRVIAEAFGFDLNDESKAARLWLEEFDPGHEAINVLQLDEDCT
jgi:hypothetical protein